MTGQGEDPKYTDVIVEIKGGIGIITLNRPDQLNSFGGNLIIDLIGALYQLDKHPETIFTVITGAGRFFSAGADVMSSLTQAASDLNDSEGETTPQSLKVAFMQRFAPAVELLRSMIDHRKVLVIAMNGPAVGAGAAWFQSYADLIYASTTTFFELSFSSLGLVPEAGCAPGFGDHMGVRRANEVVMFGRRIQVDELVQYGLVNGLFPAGEGFLPAVVELLEQNLQKNDGRSMLEAKRLQNAGRRPSRMMAVVDSFEALSNRFVEGAPTARFLAKRDELEKKRQKNKPQNSKL